VLRSTNYSESPGYAYLRAMRVSALSLSALLPFLLCALRVRCGEIFFQP
jgi:hypothetical protein